uniref:Uncharacterized protein n=1 Tax=viral metagenome TaxID=1070528 RepID=A0A6C0JV73_9ZZZZ
MIDKCNSTFLDVQNESDTSISKMPVEGLVFRSSEDPWISGKREKL